ncbi:zinc-binding protein [gamma proteobacterium IMCC2047]|nr:zinc-binding protein [gamma proteobacterium IMCC2047]
MPEQKTTAIVACPTCKKSTAWSNDNPNRPFCCERCKLIDLGAWANEENSIPGDPVNPYVDENNDDFY